MGRWTRGPDIEKNAKKKGHGCLSDRATTEGQGVYQEKTKDATGYANYHNLVHKDYDNSRPTEAERSKKKENSVSLREKKG